MKQYKLNILSKKHKEKSSTRIRQKLDTKISLVNNQK